MSERDDGEKAGGGQREADRVERCDLEQDRGKELRQPRRRRRGPPTVPIGAECETLPQGRSEYLRRAGAYRGVNREFAAAETVISNENTA